MDYKTVVPRKIALAMGPPPCSWSFVRDSNTPRHRSSVIGIPPWGGRLPGWSFVKNSRQPRVLLSSVLAPPHTCGHSHAVTTAGTIPAMFNSKGQNNEGACTFCTYSLRMPRLVPDMMALQRNGSHGESAGRWL